MSNAENLSLIAALLTATPAGDVQLLSTPARGDNDLSLATTAFVQRALGNMSGVKYVTAPYTLIADDAGKFIIASGVGTITYPANVFPAGSGVAISAQVAGNDITIAHSMPFSYGGTQVNGIALRDDENVSIISQGNGSSPLVYAGGLRSSPDFAFLGTNPGYQRLPSGIMIQWGTATGTSSGGKVVALPIPAKVATLFAMGIVASSAAGYVCTTSNKTTAGFTAHTWQNATTRGDANFDWLAITI